MNLSNRTTVYWAPASSAAFVTGQEHPYDDSNAVDDLFIEEPVSVLSVVSKDPKRQYLHTDPMNMSAAYKKCPAYTTYLKNVYQLNSIADIKFTIDADRKIVSVDAPEWVRSRISFRTLPSKDTYILITLAIYVIFYSKKPVQIEQLPPFLSTNPRSSQFTVVPGTFDISQWVRPLEFSIEIKDHVSNFEIKKGDPLCYVRFCSEDGALVKLEKTGVTKELNDAVAACMAVKNIEPGNTLQQNYVRVKNIILGLFKKKLRCPFRFR